MKRRSKYSTGGAGRGNDRKAVPETSGPPSAPPEQGSLPGHHQPLHQADLPSPHAGKPLDGSQYLDVIEEQQYSEQRPDPERPRRNP
jgi:hypothetical protein